MYSVGNAFHSAAQGDNRQVVVRATFNNNVVVNGEYIKSFLIKDDFNSGETLTIGNTCSSELSLNMYMPDTLTPTIIKNSEIFIEIGFLEITETLSAIDTQLYVDTILGYLYQNRSDSDLTFSLSNGEIIVTNPYNDVIVTLDGNEVKISSNVTDIAQFTFFVPMGVFYVDSLETSDDYRSVQIKAYDGMSLIENIDGTYENSISSIKLTAIDLISDIADKINVEFEVDETLPNTDVEITNPVFNDKTYKEMLGYFASFIGGNAYFTRLGKLSVKGYKQADYVISRSQQYLAGLKKTTDDELTINSVTCTSPEKSKDVEKAIDSFTFGHLQFTDGKPVNGITGGMFYYFYSIMYDVVPGTIYTLSRKNSTGSIHIFCYDSDKKFLGSTDDDKTYVNYTDKRMYDNDTSWNFTVVNASVRYIRIMVCNSKYTKNSSGNVVIDNNYTLTKTSVSGGTTKLGDGYGITFLNPYITNTTHLQPIYEFYKGLHYQPQTVKYRGNPAIDKGDIVKIENKDGKITNALITSQTLNISGGMNCTLTSVGKIDSDVAISNSSSFASGKSSPSKKVEELKSLILNANNLLTGVTGGFVKFVYDSYGKPRAICIAEKDVVVSWNESAGRVECPVEMNLWTWNNNGFAHSSNGGKSYDDVAITMDGKIVAQILAAVKGYIGNWTITDKSIYASYNDNGNTFYVVLNSTGTIAFAAGASEYSNLSDAHLLLMKSGNIRLRNGAGIHTNNTSGDNVGAVLLTNSSTDSGDAVFFGAGKYKPDAENEETGMTTYLRGSTIRMYAHNGGVYLGTSGSTAVTSDRNFKDSFDMDERYFNFFEKLHPVLYKYKGNNHHRKHIGFIAQDVETALSESGLTTEEFAGVLIEKNFVVTKDESEADEDIVYDKLYALRYEEFIALNTMIIQNQQKQINELTKRIERLEAKNGDN